MTFAPRSHAGSDPAPRAGSRRDARTSNPQVGAVVLTVRDVQAPRGSRTIGKRCNWTAQRGTQPELSKIEAVDRQGVVHRRTHVVDPLLSYLIELSGDPEQDPE